MSARAYAFTGCQFIRRPLPSVGDQFGAQLVELPRLPLALDVQQRERPLAVLSKPHLAAFDRCVELILALVDGVPPVRERALVASDVGVERRACVSMEDPSESSALVPRPFEPALRDLLEVAPLTLVPRQHASDRQHIPKSRQARIHPRWMPICGSPLDLWVNPPGARRLDHGRPCRP
jgi:hypothetical protein